MMLVDPLGVILYLRFMPVALTVYYSAVTFGSLYVLNVSIQYTFERKPYEFTTIIIGLLYLPNSVGYMLASIFGGRWMDSIMKREAMRANRIDEQGKLIFYPEDRMRENAWLGALLYPAALIWYGWTAENGVFWVAPVSHCQAPRLYAGTRRLTRMADDRKLFLRSGLDAHFCHVHDDADRIHASQIVFWRRLEQFLSEYLFLCWWHCWSALDSIHWQWLAVYYSGTLGIFQRGGHLGHEAVWAAVAREARSRTWMITFRRQVH